MDAPPPGVRFDTWLAKKAGFSSRDQYHRAKAVVEHGCDELIQAMDNNTLAISVAALLSKLPHGEQRALLALGVKAAKAKAKELRTRPARPAREQSVDVVAKLQFWWSLANEEERDTFLSQLQQ